MQMRRNRLTGGHENGCRQEWNILSTCDSLHFSLLVAPVYKLWRGSEEKLSTFRVLLRTTRFSS